MNRSNFVKLNNLKYKKGSLIPKNLKSQKLDQNTFKIFSNIIENCFKLVIENKGDKFLILQESNSRIQLLLTLLIFIVIDKKKNIENLPASQISSEYRLEIYL